MIDRPILLFDSFTKQDKVMACLGYAVTDWAPEPIESCAVSVFVPQGQHDGTRCLYSSVVRVQGNGVQEWREKCMRLQPHCSAFMIMFHNQLGTHPTPALLAQKLGVQLNAEATRRLEAAISIAPRRLEMPQQQQQQQQPSFPLVFFNMGPAAAREDIVLVDNDEDDDLVLMDDDDDDDNVNRDDANLQAALDASLNHYQNRELPHAPLKRELDQVLRPKSDPACDGDPVCVVCMESRASICFVPCGHQVACDECVRTWWTHGDLQHKCMVCKEVCVQVTRPICSNKK